MSQDKEPILSFTKKDFRIEWFSGTGAGGQHRNKHQNCCRIIHLETGIMTTGQNSRERPANQKEAFHKLVAKILPLYLAKEDASIHKSNERIRTYHEPRNICTDHASGVTRTYKEVVTDGNLGDLLDARRIAKCADQLDEMVKKDND